YDIEQDGVQLRWNSAQVDWIASATSLDEVGSIHTVQGYDLNYAGVIIGPDLLFDPTSRRLYIERSQVFAQVGIADV
ncbi:DNA/RNA helicase domain-containing protein, partial [Rhizobium johnstonii]|uniref:DNA/RNA helicase domain-containing protein n=1 Tax=Rhizobium johnstonii TaxID=3019933 RepID=UPI003F99A5ED